MQNIEIKVFSDRIDCLSGLSPKHRLLIYEAYFTYVRSGVMPEPTGNKPVDALIKIWCSDFDRYLDRSEKGKEFAAKVKAQSAPKQKSKAKAGSKPSPEDTGGNGKKFSPEAEEQGGDSIATEPFLDPSGLLSEGDRICPEGESGYPEGESWYPEGESGMPGGAPYTNTYTDTDTNTYTDTDTNTRALSKSPSLGTEKTARDAGGASEENDLFKEFWSEYPRKIHRADTVRIFNSLKPDRRLLDEMKSSIRKYIASDAWESDNGRFIPGPDKWLSDRAWESVPRKTSLGFMPIHDDYAAIIFGD